MREKYKFEARNEGAGTTSPSVSPVRSPQYLHLLSRVSLPSHLKEAALCFYPVVTWNHGLCRSPSVRSYMISEVMHDASGFATVEAITELPHDLTPHSLESNCRPSDTLCAWTFMLSHSLRLRSRLPRLWWLPSPQNHLFIFFRLLKIGTHSGLWAQLSPMRLPSLRLRLALIGQLEVPQKH